MSEHLDTFEVQIKEREIIDHTLKLRLGSDHVKQWDFLAGQYLWLEVFEADYRPYSIASSAADPYLELHIRLDEENPTLVSLSAKQPGTSLRIRLADGRCTLQRIDQRRPILFIAGGTGYAPCQAMLLTLFDQPQMPATALFWGAHRAIDLYAENTLLQWAEARSEFSFYPVLQEPERQSKYHQGLVHEAVLKHVESLADYDIYLAGSEPMVLAVHDALIREGAEESQIYSDMLDLMRR